MIEDIELKDRNGRCRRYMYYFSLGLMSSDAKPRFIIGNRWEARRDWSWSP